MAVSLPDSYDFSHKFAIRAGLLLIGGIGVLSLIASSSLLCFATRSMMQRHIYAPLEPVDKLFRCLILADAVQAISGILISYWAFKGEVIEDKYCTVQAIIRQLGDIAVAQTTLAVGVLTFIQVYRPLWIPSRRYSLISNTIIFAIFVYLLLIIALPWSLVPGYYVVEV